MRNPFSILRKSVMRHAPICLALMFSLTLSAEKSPSVTDTSLIAQYPLNGNAKNSVKNGTNGKSTRVKATADRNGSPKSASLFNPGPGMEFSMMEFPIDISPKKYPEITITFWIKAEETFKNLAPLQSGNDESRRIITRTRDGAQRWCASAGKDGNIYGSAVLKDQWTFIAVVYDSPNEQARLIVNNEIFAGRARMGNSNPGILAGSFKGAMDELMIFGRALSLEEIETIYGSQIDKNREDFAIKDRSSYRKKLETRKLSGIKEGDQFIVGYKELIIRDSIRSLNTLYIFSEGDTISVVSEMGKDWFLVTNPKGEQGYVSGKTLKANAYRTGDFKPLFRLLNWLSQIFMMNRFANWIVAAIFLAILYFAVKYREKLNNWFARIGNQSETEAFASKAQKRSGIKRPPIFQKYFPVQYPKWWMIAPGLLFGLMIIGGSFWDSSELEWFFSEGAKIIPQDFTLPIHWVLWAVSLVIIMLIIALALESLSIAGPMAGLLRFAMLAVLNVMAIMVFLYLLAGIIMIILGIILLIFALAMLFSGGSRRRYDY